MKKAIADGNSFFHALSPVGFTLIEMLMVIMLVGILSAVVVPQFIDYRVEARREVTRKRLTELKTAIIGDPNSVVNGVYTNPGFRNTVGSFPAALNDLAAQGAYPAYDPFTRRGWRGPYVTTSDPTWNRDAWGTAFGYDSAARTITSCGPNLTCGNGDDIIINF